MTLLIRRAVPALAAVAVVGGLLTAGGTAAAQTAPQTRAHSAVPAAAVAGLRAQLRSGALSASTDIAKICADHHLPCLAEALAAPGSSEPLSSSKPIGLGADDLAAAYQLNGAAAGSGTIAVVDAGAYPILGKDLAVYRKQYGLPSCTMSSGCLTVRNYTGGKQYPTPKDDFARFVTEIVSVETALDLEMASAACPTCKLMEIQVPVSDLLVGTTAGIHRTELHFAEAARTAHQLGADAVSYSWGFSGDAYTDHGAPSKLLRIPGMAITASSGDSGNNGSYSVWPQGLSTVVSVGGTSLYRRVGSAGWAETGWDGAGSGCNPAEPAAAGQYASVAAQCGGHRASADISAVADPFTGVAVYNSYSPYFHEPYNWITVGGTSASAPFVAGLYARAGVPAGTVGPAGLYAAPGSAFRDITIGANAPRGWCASQAEGERLCTAAPGWDGATGRGTPRGLSPFQAG